MLINKLFKIYIKANINKFQNIGNIKEKEKMKIHGQFYKQNKEKYLI